MYSRSMGSDGKDGMLPAGLARQSSIYSLTFDEFQTTLGGVGKDFGSMNMDELLKNIWTAEETQAMTVGALGEMSSTVGAGAVGGLQRQGSLTLPRTLSQKTVDEVWRELFKEGSGSGQGGAAEASLQPQQREPTLGEMTLEEFLVRAGAVMEEPAVPGPRQIITPANTGPSRASASNKGNVLYGGIANPQLNSSPGLALDFSPAVRAGGIAASTPVPSNPSATGLMMNLGTVRPPMQLGNAHELATQNEMKAGGIIGIGDPVLNTGLMPGVVGLNVSPVTVAAVSPGNNLPSDGRGKANGKFASLSAVPYLFNGGLRGRKCGGALEKVVERRQRRMIKNRESAARSRARKQAYTMELEAEVAKLKEQNEELQKKQAEILEMQKSQIMEAINKQCGSKKLCLRRTQTGPW
ncbi:hypothetical protein Taro_014924 [Colocasia esculenta]|uniref:BZIP domain-containing protein n=1 Tax=Colocasia esculenta TaxID=4460 RepID=A0A843UG65_COLES|nr:hypothetical protein [Colocasia esculenta]